MFKFFTQRKWHLWSIGGTIIILVATWYQVQLDVRINEWFGEFYDTLQKALTEPNSVTEKDFIAYLFTFAKEANELIRPIFGPSGVSIGQTRP